jgi:hypothetical protein
MARLQVVRMHVAQNEILLPDETAKIIRAGLAV